jgi:hypothetical protein
VLDVNLAGAFVYSQPAIQNFLSPAGSGAIVKLLKRAPDHSEAWIYLKTRC